MSERDVSHESQLAEFARELSETIKAGAIIGLRGPMGVGKSTFVRHFLNARGLSGPFPSPTYSLMLEYFGAQGERYIHIDAYRLQVDDELPFDWREWGEAIVFVEWPERLNVPLKHFHYEIEWEFLEGDSSRFLRLKKLAS